ncbi:hypothetical protein [Polymorphospora sp. NPDC050346]|uniref:hypothetical protein n=1 Tax=Polymorphospora sp. NPDC050346 TaxID=3155780 RepID=UPI0034034A6C
MALQIDRQEGPQIPEGTVTCDLEASDDCHTMMDLGRHPTFTDEQFHELVKQQSWVYEQRHQQWACPPCSEHELQRRRPVALAGEGFPTPFGTAPRRGRDGTSAGPG